MTYPTTQEIYALHKKYAPTEGVLEVVWQHCTIVAEIAQQLIRCNNLKVDAELVRVGCLLHDIGVNVLFGEDNSLLPGRHYITHGTEGEKILRAEGFPEQIYRFASHHTGVGLSADDVVAQKLPLPAQDFLAETDEELLVMYADKFHSKVTPPVFNSYGWYKAYVAQFGADKPVLFEEMGQKFGIPDITTIAQVHQQLVR